MGVPDYERLTENGIKAFNANPNISAKEKELFNEFIQDYGSRGNKGKPLSPATICKYPQRVGRMLEMLKPDLTEATEKDLRNMEAEINTAKLAKVFFTGNQKKEKRNVKLTPGGIEGYKICFQVFYNWIRDNYPDYDLPKLKRIKWAVPHERNYLTADDILSEQEEEKVRAKTGDDIQQRARFELELEIGARPAELAKMRIKDVHLDAREPYVDIPQAKTIPRQNPINRSYHWLNLWIMNHPNKGDPESALWVTRHRAYKGEKFKSEFEGWYYEPMDRVQLSKWSKNLFDRAGVKKNKTSIYIFRHTRITRDLRSGLNLSVIKKLRGVKTEKAFKSYDHLTSGDAIEAWRKAQGLKSVKKPEPTTTQCPHCDYINEADREACYRCHSPLTLEESNRRMEINKQQEQATALIGILQAELRRSKIDPDKDRKEASRLISKIILEGM